MNFIFRKNLVLVLVASLFLLTQSCKVKKAALQTATVTPQKVIPTTDSLVQKFLQQAKKIELNYQWFSARMSVEYNDGKIDQSFNATVRMRKDSIIWLSLYGPFGIEGARILVTRDSVQIINRLSNEYTKKPLSYIQKYLPVKADLPMLQDFVMGYYLKFKNTVNTSRGVADSLAVIRFEEVAFSCDVSAYLQNYTMANYVLTDKMVKQQMDVTFDEYSEIVATPFSTKRKIAIKRGNELTKLNLEFSKFKINERLDFPFDIGNNLNKVE